MEIQQFITSMGSQRPVTDLCGWAGRPTAMGGLPELVAEAFELWSTDAANSTEAVKSFRALPYKAGGRAALWETGRKVIGTDTLNYAQEIGDPFYKGTLVSMANGSEKAVEDLVVGDMVVNHKNQPVRVNRVIKKKFTGDLVTIKVKGWHRTLTATEFHHGMKLPYTQYRFKYSGSERVQFGDYEVGDYILTPFGFEANKNIVLDLTDLVAHDKYDQNYIYSGKYKLPRYIPVDAKFARLLGLYLAEGGVGTSNKVVTWSLHSEEISYMQEIQNSLMEIFGVKSSIWKTGCEKCRRVGSCNPMVYDFFKSISPGNVYSKTIPTFIFQTLRSIRFEVIRGWLDGDGHKKEKVNAVIGYTSSDNLGDSMLRLATSCGLRCSSWRRFRKKRSSVPNTEVALYGTEVSKVYSNVAAVTKTVNITCRDTPYGLARKIEKIERHPVVDEDVYCITTEGEYTAIFNGIASYQCVSFGAKNAIEYLQFYPIANGERDKWTRVFPPYLYGAGRVFIGKGQMGREDGSVGAWQAEAVMKYGTIPIDAPNCPAYSGQVAKRWGNSGPPDEFVPVGQQHIVKATAPIRTWEDLVTAVTNGYPVTVASNVGYDMEPRADGFNHYSTHWGHQMCITMVDDDASEPYGGILNSWSDVHGHIKDFKTGEMWPVGMIRARKADIVSMLQENDSFSYSSTGLFKTQTLPDESFDLWS